MARPSKAKGDKYSLSELAHHVALKMDRLLSAPRSWPEFPERFYIVEDSAKRKSVVEDIGNKVVEHRVDSYVTEKIFRYCTTQLSSVPGAQITYRQAEAIRQAWVSLTRPLAEAPLALAEKSDDRYTFKRLTFDAPITTTEDGIIKVPPCPPCFAEFLGRCTHATAIAAFIGSLFYPESNRQQYLYIYGEGQDGKGALLRMLFELLGSAVQPMQPKEKGDRFWNFRAYGKRLLLFTDCGDTTYFMSPDFKALTGEDPLFFEEKGKMGFAAIPSCKVLVASNVKPSISTQKSDLRRLIFATVRPFDQDKLQDKYEKFLLLEAEHIVRFCKAIYLANCDGHGPIPVMAPTEIGEDTEDPVVELFHQHFLQDDQSTYLHGSVVLDVLRQARISNVGVKGVKDVWARRLGISYRKNVDGRICWHGMRRRPFGTEDTGG